MVELVKNYVIPVLLTQRSLRKPTICADTVGQKILVVINTFLAIVKPYHVYDLLYHLDQTHIYTYIYISFSSTLSLCLSHVARAGVFFFAIRLLHFSLLLAWS